jgi:hypothetical protein
MEKPGHVIKTYQTNSDLLLQIKDREGTPRSVMELQTIIEVINKALKALCTDPDKQLIARLKFKPEGCIWRLAFHPSLGNSADQSYRAEVICFANAAEEVNSRTNYLIESTLIPTSAPADDADRPSTLIPSHLEGYKEAKAAFEIIAVAVRKAVVRLEFPNFPHGGGPALFRDIYQLNARVRSEVSHKAAIRPHISHPSVLLIGRIRSNQGRSLLCVAELTVNRVAKLP